jgi:16S rRNA (guanine527-N7)-methyltransferase
MPRLTDADRALLLTVLGTAKEEGALGPGPVEEHLDHALGWAEALPYPAVRFADLGSGGGVPGLVLALAMPDATAVLIDARARRCESLDRALEVLGIGDRVEVVAGRAEELGRRDDLRASFDLVVARGFGPPPATAECAAPLLRLGGHLSVSEPPESRDDRWPPDGMAELGFSPPRVERVGGSGYMVVELVHPCSDRYPRRNGIPEKRPLW